MKTLTNISALIAITAIVSSCTNEDLYVGDTGISPINANTAVLTGMPFATDADLQTAESDATLVNWQVARKLAMVDMELQFKNDMGWQGAKVSAKPVFIYGSDSRPKYYEFVVHNEYGEPLGTLVTYAKREMDAATAFVLPTVRDYSAATTKFAGLQMFATTYPKVAYGIVGKGGDDPTNVVTDDGENAVSLVEGSMADLVEQYEQSGIKDEDLQQIRQQVDETALYAAAYWQLMDEIKDSILATTDEQIIERCNNSKGLSEWTTEEIYRIPAYNTTGMYYTRWDGYCGPSAMAWLYRGLYSSYGGKNIYVYGNSQFNNGDSRITRNSRGAYSYLNNGDDDNDGRKNSTDLDWIQPRSTIADNGLYYELCRRGGLQKDGGMYYWNCATAFNGVTGGQYSLSGTNYSDARSTIRNKNLPVLVALWDKTHFVAGFGIRNVDYHYKLTATIKILCWSKTINISSGSWRQSEWMLVTDNGYLTSGFNYAPYWQQTYVYLHQKVVKNW